MIYVVLFFLGSLIGSFCNVLIYRIPRGESIIQGRSHCVHCNRRINWYDLAPIVSFLILQRSCRLCGRTISWQYPIIECVSGVLLVLCYIFFGHYDTAAWLLLFGIIELFLVLAVIDAQHFLLPDALLLSLLILALAYRLYITTSISVLGYQHGRLLHDTLWALGIFVVLGGLWFLSNGRLFGFGDVKLMSIVGFFFGIISSSLIFYGAICSAALVGIALIIMKRATMKTPFPFGSYIAFTTLVYLFFGMPVLRFSTMLWQSLVH